MRGRLIAALLYAGPGAMLSHTTAEWWWAMRKTAPRVIYVTTPRRCLSLEGMRVHTRPNVKRTFHDGLPLTTVEQTLLDISSMLSFNDLRRAIAEAEFLRLIDVNGLENFRRWPGNATLRKALANHQPRLADARNHLEVEFIFLCERFSIEIPQINVLVEGFEVDAFWPLHGLVAELDGGQAHANPAAMERDRRRDLTLRLAGLDIVRYTRSQVLHEPAAVAADLSAGLARPTIRAFAERWPSG